MNKVARDESRIMEIIEKEKKYLLEFHEQLKGVSFDERKVYVAKFLEEFEQRLKISLSEFRTDIEHNDEGLSKEEVVEIINSFPAADFIAIHNALDDITRGVRDLTPGHWKNEEKELHAAKLRENIQHDIEELFEVMEALTQKTKGMLEMWLHDANIEQDKKKQLLQFGRERKQHVLSQRRRFLKKIGLRQGIAKDLDTINNEFLQEYGISFDGLLEIFSEKVHELWAVNGVRSNIRIIYDELRRYKNENHIILFPLKGMVFNYYVAKGMETEIIREGGHVRVITIITRGHSENSIIRWNVRRQAKKIVCANKDMKSFSILDDTCEGATERQIVQAFEGLGLFYNGLTHTRERQRIPLGDKYWITTHRLFEKRDAERLAYRSENTNAYHKGDDGQIVSKAFNVGKVKFMLTSFGRVYYRLANA